MLNGRWGGCDVDWRLYGVDVMWIGAYMEWMGCGLVLIWSGWDVD